MADPWEVRPVGATQLRVTTLGFGAASIGGLYAPVAEAVAIDVADHAYDLGVRYFDVAPMYGYGNSERRLGASLAARDRASFVLSTKVGRLLRADAPPDPGQRFAGQDDYFYKGTPPVNPMFDYSHDGVLRSVEESLAASAWTASTSSTSMTRTTTGRRPSAAPTRRWSGCAARAWCGPSARA